MNIRVDLSTPIYDGAEVVFRSPVDCSQVTGLIVYYTENGNISSREFAFADAHGNDVGNIDHLFAENVVVKVILDLATNMAFVQNADTNAYLEWRFKDTIDKLCPSFTESGSVVTCEPIEGYPLEVNCSVNPNLLPDDLLQGNWANEDGAVDGFERFCDIPNLPSGEYTIYVGNNGSGVVVYSYDTEAGGWVVKVNFMELTDSTEAHFTHNGGALRLEDNGWSADASVLKLEIGTEYTGTDYATKITRCGKNLCETNAVEITSTDMKKVIWKGSISAPVVVSVDVTGIEFANPNASLIQCTVDGAIKYASPNNMKVKGYAITSGTLTEIKVINWSNGTGMVKFQLEVGTEKTAYEPYNGDTFAPGEAITAIQGVNTIFANTGDITVKGKADPVAIINKLSATVAALTGV